MDREITWTDPAWEDVENAADYIAQDSEFYAAAFVQEIKEAALRLPTSPNEVRLFQSSATNLSENFVRSYRLVYKVSEKQILILTLIHGAQRLRRF